MLRTFFKINVLWFEICRRCKGCKMWFLQIWYHAFLHFLSRKCNYIFVVKRLIWPKLHFEDFLKCMLYVLRHAGGVVSENVILADFITQIAKINDCWPCSRPDFSAAIWSLYLGMVPLERMTTVLSNDIIFKEITSLGTENQLSQNSKIRDFSVSWYA